MALHAIACDKVCNRPWGIPCERYILWTNAAFPDNRRKAVMPLDLLIAIIHTQGQKFNTTGKIVLNSIHHDTWED